MEPRRLGSPPILEALIDFRIRPQQELALEQLSTLPDGLAKKYPTSDQVGVVSVEIRNDPKQGTSDQRSGLEQVGYRFAAPDKRRFVQYRTDGFTYNWLGPYDSWQRLREESAYAWSGYVKLAHPREVSRAALRYINLVKIPGHTIELDDFLQFSVDAYPRLGLELNGYSHRVLVRDPETENKGVVQVKLEDGGSDGWKLFLDIDVHRVGAFHPEGDALERVLDSLREFKNRLFFGAMTDRYLETLV